MSTQNLALPDILHFLTNSSLIAENTIMYLYNLTLQRATGITHAIHGSFAGTKLQEIAVSKGKVLELLRPDPSTGKVVTLLSVEVFGIIRSMMAFRLTGGSKDYLVIGSDSGRIVILEYHPLKNVFEKVRIPYTQWLL